MPHPRSDLKISSGWPDWAMDAEDKSESVYYLKISVNIRLPQTLRAKRREEQKIQTPADGV